MKGELDRLEKNVKQMHAFVHDDGATKTRAQSAQKPAKSESLTRKSKEELSDSGRALNRLRDTFMQKFDETNAFLEQ